MQKWSLEPIVRDKTLSLYKQISTSSIVELVHIPNLGFLPNESAYIHKLPQKLRVFQSLAYSFFP
jgi:hypothetical protein